MIQSLSTHAKLLTPAETIERLASTASRAPVIVTLHEPGDAPEKLRSILPGVLAEIRVELADRRAAVLSKLPAAHVTLQHAFENQAGFSCEVDLDGLQSLLDDPMVAAIEPVRYLEPHDAQALPLMNALATRSQFDGSGTSIAICDTGIDTAHPMLGSGGFPNAKVIGGYDFGMNDSNPRPSGSAHGTACAGIAAGLIGFVDDYIGGVAPAAKLYSLKISRDSDHRAPSDAIIAAWDWCVTHQNDDPANPISVISMSFGGGRYLAACDAESPALKLAADRAINAGIAILVSSGNDGYCDATGWPACLSGVISVGAVYDAPIGTLAWCVAPESCAAKGANANCPTGFSATQVSAADRVTAYSNSAPFLTLLAPSHNAYSPDIVGTAGYSSGNYIATFGGTSAACPYAAGAAAALQSAAKIQTGRFLTAAQVRQLLASTGDFLTDSRFAFTVPRINLGRAIGEMTAIGANPPSNDACVNALVVAPGLTLAGNLGATTDGVAACDGSSGSGSDVWFRFSPSTDGPVDIATCGSSFDTVLSVYDACAAAERACNDNEPGCGFGSRLSLSAVRDQPLWIRVAGSGGETGFILLDIDDGSGAAGGLLAPDLRIIDLDAASPNPQVAELIEIHVEIANRGDVDAGPFQLHIWRDADPSPCGGDAVAHIAGLPAHSTLRHLFAVSYDRPGDKQLSAWVDACDSITESNESNNLKSEIIHLKPAPASASDPCVNQGGDSDNDGICDQLDNCPGLFNPSQDDSDNSSPNCDPNSPPLDSCATGLCGTLCTPLTELSILAMIVALVSRDRPVRRRFTPRQPPVRHTAPEPRRTPRRPP